MWPIYPAEIRRWFVEALERDEAVALGNALERS